MVKTDYQVYFLALSTYAAKQSLNDLSLQALKLDLRAKVIQSELVELLYTLEAQSTVK